MPLDPDRESHLINDVLTQAHKLFHLHRLAKRGPSAPGPRYPIGSLPEVTMVQSHELEHLRELRDALLAAFEH